MQHPIRTFTRHALATAVVLALAGAAQAQIASSTVKGQIAAAQAGTTVTAVNTATGTSYRTTTQADGSYVLTGLAPGSYEIRVGSQKSQVITVAVGETASVDLSLAGAQQITIVGTAARKDVKTSEVGTNVSRRMIEALPQTTRNFLSAADLAPGVAFNADSESGYTTLRGGSQNKDNVNVFIDGVGQKNNILRGGVTGQDSSRGNPFPQSAIAEYKVLTQNYKAEFEQVSSAAVSAITKSGTNTLSGEAYVDRTGTNWRSLTPKEIEREAAGVPLPPSSKYEFGASLGGPVSRDAVHFFVAYDGKEISDSRQIKAQNLNKFVGTGGLIPRLKAASGSQVDKFTEHLFFGKVDAQLNDENRLSFSLRMRDESDRVPENKDLSLPGNDKNRKNDETRFDLKHEWSRGSWLNEARIGHEDATWNPSSAQGGAFIKYKVSSSAQQRLTGSSDVLFDGGSPDNQKRSQKGTFFQDDLTYTGLKGHVIKGGVKLKAMTYDLSGTSRGVDIVEALVDNTTGALYFDGTNCLGTNLVVSSTQQTSDQCKLDKAIAAVRVNYKNNQLGLYLQDDWAVTKQLELNLGVRYDVESNMLNNAYVTPADRVAALKGLDGRNVAGIQAPAGQTYAQSLAKGGINIDDYISNGNSRRKFTDAIAPRLGASYDLFGNRASVIFGGWGRSYDRTMANHALDELQKNKQPNGEIWLIRNDFKMPYSDQATIGLRQALGTWNAEIALSHVQGHNQFVWFGGNRDPNGGWGTQSSIDPLWGGPNGFGTLILGDFVGATKTNSVLAKLEKPYTRASGWSASVAYTFSDAKTTHKEWNEDMFDWTYGRTAARGWNTSTLVDKHRIVAAGFVENLMNWGVNLSAKLTWASGFPRRITSCAAGWSQCVYVQADSPSYSQLDMGVSKDFKVWGHTLSLRADVLNLFNTTNLNGFDDWGGGPVATGGQRNAVGGDNLNLGKANGSIRGDIRTLRLGLNLKF